MYQRGEQVASGQNLGGLTFHIHPFMDDLAVHIDKRHAVRRCAERIQHGIAVICLVRLVDGDSGRKYGGVGRGCSCHTEKQTEGHEGFSKGTHILFLLLCVMSARRRNMPPVVERKRQVNARSCPLRCRALKINDSGLCAADMSFFSKSPESPFPSGSGEGGAC